MPKISDITVIEREGKEFLTDGKTEYEMPALTMVDNSISAQQILFVMQKTPSDHVYQRPAKGGGVWDYVTGTYVKKVLNYTFGWKWSFEVKEHGKEGDLIWVLGKLTVQLNDGTSISKEQFGRADIKFKTKMGQDGKKVSTGVAVDYGNDLKAATTDALKKCAAELGIANDIYGKNEFKEIKLTEIAELPAPTKKEVS